MKLVLYILKTLTSKPGIKGKSLYYTFWDDICNFQGRNEVVDVTLNALSHTRVLNFHGHRPPIMQCCQMDLTNGGCGKGTLIEGGNFGSPVLTQLVCYCSLLVKNVVLFRQGND